MHNDAIQQLRELLHGDVFAPGDPGYDEARRVHNGAIDRYPAVVAGCSGAADVITAVRFAREHELPVGIRGGGHSVAGHGTCDGGLLVDLSLQRAVHVDPSARTARVQGGATLSDVDRETQAFGLAVPTGQVSATGIAGLTLNGGLGMLQRKYGLTCDNLRSADVVTATGDMVIASETENSELFWALRGGGGNFGVVTSFEFDLHPIGPMVTAGLVAYPVERAPEVLEFFRDFIEDAPRELSADVIFQVAPPLEIIPEEMQGVTPLIGVFVRYAGPEEECHEVIRPLQEFGDPVINSVGPISYVDVQALLDPLNPSGLPNYWSGEYLPKMDTSQMEKLAEHGSRLPNPMSIIEVIPFNAAPTEVPADATAFAHREDSWLIHIMAQWIDEDDADPCRQWVKRTGRDLQELGSGDVYLNLVTDDEETDRVRAFWDDHRLARLAAVKTAYDPGNVFRFNHNILPAPPAKDGGEPR